MSTTTSQPLHTTAVYRRPAASLPAPAAGDDRLRAAVPAFVPIHVAVTGTLAVLACGAIALGLHEPAEHHDVLALLSGAGIAALVLYLRYGLDVPWLSAPVVYLALYGVFYCGLVTTAALVPSVLDGMDPSELEWMAWPNVRVAMLLSVAGAAAFTLGAGLGHRAGRPAADGARPDDAAMSGAGWVLLLAGLAGTTLVLVQSGGPAVFGLSYLEFRRDVLEPTWLQSAGDLAQVGCLMVLAGARRPDRGGRQWLAALLLWAALAGAPMLLLGLRGEALVPLAAYAVVLVRRGLRIRAGALWLAVLVVAVVIPAVQAIRIVGLSNRSLVSWTEVTPLASLTELGGSLRAVKAYVDWIEEGDPLLLGASYWAPFDRQVLTRLPPVGDSIPYESDERIPLRLMDSREGAVGGAALGEAYYNFGTLGPLLFFAPVGLLVGWLDRRAGATPQRCAALGVAMLLLLPNIRGDWLAIPAQAAIMAAVLVATRACGAMVRGVRARW